MPIPTNHISHFTVSRINFALYRTAESFNDLYKFYTKRVSKLLQNG